MFVALLFAGFFDSFEFKIERVALEGSFRIRFMSSEVLGLKDCRFATNANSLRRRKEIIEAVYLLGVFELKSIGMKSCISAKSLTVWKRSLIRIPFS